MKLCQKCDRVYSADVTEQTVPITMRKMENVRVHVKIEGPSTEGVPLCPVCISSVLVKMAEITANTECTYYQKVSPAKNGKL